MCQTRASQREKTCASVKREYLRGKRHVPVSNESISEGKDMCQVPTHLSGISGSGCAADATLLSAQCSVDWNAASYQLKEAGPCYALKCSGFCVTFKTSGRFRGVMCYISVHSWILGVTIPAIDSGCAGGTGLTVCSCSKLSDWSLFYLSYSLTGLWQIHC